MGYWQKRAFIDLIHTENDEVGYVAIHASAIEFICYPIEWELIFVSARIPRIIT